MTNSFAKLKLIFGVALTFALQAGAEIDLSSYEGRIGKLQSISNSGISNDVLDCRVEDFGDSEYPELKNKIGIVAVKNNYANGDWPRFSYQGKVYESKINYGEPGKVFATQSAGGFPLSGCQPFERIIPIYTRLYLWPNTVAIEGKVLCGEGVYRTIAICRFGDTQ